MDLAHNNIIEVVGVKITMKHAYITQNFEYSYTLDYKHRYDMRLYKTADGKEYLSHPQIYDRRSSTIKTYFKSTASYTISEVFPIRFPTSSSIYRKCIDIYDENQISLDMLSRIMEMFNSKDPDSLDLAEAMVHALWTNEDQIF